MKDAFDLFHEYLDDLALRRRENYVVMGLGLLPDT